MNTSFGCIPPGEKLDIEFTILVTNERSIPFMMKKEVLEDILILNFEGGSDTFVTIHGEFLPSCVGATVDMLVNSPGPIRDNNTSVKPLRPLSIPKEVRRLVDHIYCYGLDEAGLFAESGNSSEVESIRECLDTNQPFDEVEIHSVSECLVLLLKHLAIPIFPIRLLEDCATDGHLTTFCHQVLTRLPVPHYNLFIYLLSFLQEVLRHAEQNKATPQQLAGVFSGALMQSKFTGIRTKLTKAQIVILHFITSPDFVS